MFLFYVLTSVPQKNVPSAVSSNILVRWVRFSAVQTLLCFFKKGDTIQERTLFKEIRKYLKYRSCFSDSFATFLQNHFRDLALFDKNECETSNIGRYFFPIGMEQIFKCRLMVFRKPSMVLKFCYLSMFEQIVLVMFFNLFVEVYQI